MSLWVVVVGLTLGAAIRWTEHVLDDEERYLRAVTQVPRARVVRRWAGRLVAFRTGSRGAGVVTRAAMATPPFRRSWIAAQRSVHRHARQVAPARATFAMLTLAAVGDVVAISRWVGRCLRPSTIR